MLYEYRCQACGKMFALILSLAEHDKRNQSCPECKSRNIEQRMSSFTARTARKAA